MSRRQYWIGMVAAALLLTTGAAQAQWTWTPQTGRWINVKRLPKETAELQLEFARKQMLEGNLKKAMQETDKFVRFYSDSDLGDDNQFLRGEILMAQDEPRKAAKAFQSVVTSYPDSDLFEKVIAKQYEIGDQLFAKGEKKMSKHWGLYRKRPFKYASEVYAMVIDNQPFTNAAAEAQYKVGLCQFTRKEYIAAAYDYRRVIEDYPDSDWVDDASYGLASCYRAAALGADYDQTPSMLAVRAVDDFMIRFSDDPRAEELKGVRQEMRETIAQQRVKTAQFYVSRRQFDSARLAYGVVVEQYGDTSVAKEAQDWLDANPAPAHPAYGQATREGS